MPPPVDKQPVRPDPWMGAARAAVGQGLGMGWGDEAEAWLRSKLGQGTYEDQLARIRGEYAQYAKESPFTAGAMEFVGGAAPTAAAMLFPGAQAGLPTAAASTLKSIANLAALGASTGAVSGAGSATEGERLGGAGQGALIGTVVGGATPVALRAGSAGAKWLAERFAPTEARIGQVAAGKMNQALRESQLTPQQIEQILARDRSMRVPSVVANVNPALVDLAEAVAQRTGSGARKVEETLTKQKLGARERTYSQVKKGLQPGDYYDDEQKLVSDLRGRAGSLYDQAYAHGAVDDPRINTVLRDPEFAGFFNKAKEIANKEAMAAKLRGEDPSRFQLPELYSLELDPATQVLTPRVRQLPDVRTLDYMKRGIDATIDSLYTSGRGAEATALKQLRKEFVNALDENVPAYKQARSGYAGDMEVLDAMRAGMADFGKLDHEQVIKMVAGMSAAEKEAFRTGVARGLYSKIMDPSGNFNAAQRIIGSPEMQAKLQPLFENPGQFQLFKNALEREAQLFHESNRVLGGSQTGKRMQMREQLEGGPGVGEAIAGAVTGGFWNSLASLTARTIGKANISEKTASKLADMLMSRDPNEVAAVVKLLEEQAAAAAPRALRAGATEAGITTGTSSAIWPSPQPQSTLADLETELDKESATPSGPDIEEDLRREANPQR